MARPLLLTAPDLWTQALPDSPLVVVDGGARGTLFAPLDRVPPARLLVARFDPDPDAPLPERPGEVTFRAGLWRDESVQTLHLARDPSTSSIYPPDRALLEQFVDRIGWPPRQTVRTLPVPCTSIDAAFAQAGRPDPDFVKLDVHSAEYEALEGAARALAHTAVAVLVEAWPYPLHRGQRTAAEVEVLLNRAGFFAFQQRERHHWPRRSPVGYSQRQLVCTETLFFRSVPAATEIEAGWPAPRLLKAAAVADLYGHTDYAWQVLEAGRAAGALPEATGRAWQQFLVQHNRPSAFRTYLDKALVRLTEMARAY